MRVNVSVYMQRLVNKLHTGYGSRRMLFIYNVIIRHSSGEWATSGPLLCVNAVVWSRGVSECVRLLVNLCHTVRSMAGIYGNNVSESKNMGLDFRCGMDFSLVGQRRWCGKLFISNPSRVNHNILQSNDATQHRRLLSSSRITWKDKECPLKQLY